ncbi:MAG TPA: glycosyltransferase [Xanthobacteraceae bacterium]|nr:glycosyltransferase [Xanthobacteraceae bacterium]
MKLNLVFFGLSITSSWGNGHATTYRALLKALAARGHRITFLERDAPWYRDHRDTRCVPYCDIELYDSVDDVKRRYATLVRSADVVVLGSYVPDGAILGDWILQTTRGMKAFYDIDTPVTLKRIETNDAEYLRREQIARYDLYLSFTGGPALETIENVHGGPCARALYCAADPTSHSAVEARVKWHLGYIGTYSEDRQALLEALLFEPARRLPDLRFAVAGAQYPDNIAWPDNVEHIEHLPPDEHARFYCSQRYTLNLTRADMTAAGFSPSVRLFEAGACGVPVISDPWQGIETFFTPKREILLARSASEVVRILCEVPDRQRRNIASAARARVLAAHTAQRRAIEFERYLREAFFNPPQRTGTYAVA